MTKAELIERLAKKQKHLPVKDVELAVKHTIEMMSNSLSNGERIEIRGFGSFSLHFRAPRLGRNPKTGDAVSLSGKNVPHFKPGKDLHFCERFITSAIELKLRIKLYYVFSRQTQYDYFLSID